MKRIEEAANISTRYILESTGRELRLTMDILGIGPDAFNSPGETFTGIYSGYDSRDGDEEGFTAEERAEIAAFAIARWQEWARLP